MASFTNKPTWSEPPLCGPSAPPHPASPCPVLSLTDEQTSISNKCLTFHYLFSNLFFLLLSPFLLCKFLKTKTMSRCLPNVLCAFFQQTVARWNKCVSVCAWDWDSLRKFIRSYVRAPCWGGMGGHSAFNKGNYFLQDSISNNQLNFWSYT